MRPGDVVTCPECGASSAPAHATGGLSWEEGGALVASWTHGPYARHDTASSREERCPWCKERALGFRSAMGRPRAGEAPWVVRGPRLSYSIPPLAGGRAEEAAAVATTLLERQGPEEQPAERRPQEVDGRAEVVPAASLEQDAVRAAPKSAAGGHEPKSCASCGAQILWAQMLDGKGRRVWKAGRYKAIPVDWRPVPDGNVLVYERPGAGFVCRVLRRGETAAAGARLRMAHQATCAKVEPRGAAVWRELREARIEIARLRAKLAGVAREDGREADRGVPGRAPARPRSSQEASME